MKYRVQKRIFTLLAVILLLCSVVTALSAVTENRRVYVPAAEKQSLGELAAKATLTKADYDVFWRQAGLGKIAVDGICQRDGDSAAALALIQNQFYAAPPYACGSLSGFSKTERIKGKENYYTIFGLDPGDVLLTDSTFTLCYRHGHSALYLGDGDLLEAAVIGKPAAVFMAQNWGGYPTGIQLRIKEEAAQSVGMTSAELGKAVAAYAEEALLGDDYSLLAGAFGKGENSDETQCAYLVWEAYHHFGVEVSARNFPVTPSSLLKSGQFEIVRFWGFDPADISW